MSQETECKIKKVADTSLLDDGDCPKDPALPNFYGLGLARGALNPVCVLPEWLEVSKGCYGLYNVVKLCKIADNLVNCLWNLVEAALQCKHGMSSSNLPCSIYQ